MLRCEGLNLYICSGWRLFSNCTLGLGLDGVLSQDGRLVELDLPAISLLFHHVE
jgi:hypothetical protein